MDECLDIYINSSHPRSRSCSSSGTQGFTSLIDSIQCWLESGQITPIAGSTNVIITDNGNGTSDIIVDGSALATVITTATDVLLVDNLDGTSNLVVNSTSLGSVLNTPTEEVLSSSPVYDSILLATGALGTGEIFKYSTANFDGVPSPNNSVIGIT